MKPFLCRLKHKWAPWRVHPVYGDRDIRHCIRCGHAEERGVNFQERRNRTMGANK